MLSKIRQYVKKVCHEVNKYVMMLKVMRSKYCYDAKKYIITSKSTLSYAKSMSCVSKLLQLAGQQITQSQCVKFLCMHIDNCLKWDKHIKKMKQKISQSLYAIIRARSILTRENLMTLYYSMVYPYLSYGIALWGGSYKLHTSQLEIMQKKIVRIIENVPINSHTALLFKKKSEIWRYLQIGNIQKHIINIKWSLTWATACYICHLPGTTQSWHETFTGI